MRQLVGHAGGEHTDVAHALQLPPSESPAALQPILDMQGVMGWQGLAAQLLLPPEAGALGGMGKDAPAGSNGQEVIKVRAGSQGCSGA